METNGANVLWLYTATEISFGNTAKTAAAPMPVIMVKIRAADTVFAMFRLSFTAFAFDTAGMMLVANAIKREDGSCIKGIAMPVRRP